MLISRFFLLCFSFWGVTLCYSKTATIPVDYNTFYALVSDTAYYADTIQHDEAASVSNQKKMHWMCKSITIYQNNRPVKKKSFGRNGTYESFYTYDAKNRLIEVSRFLNGKMYAAVSYQYVGDSIVYSSSSSDSTWLSGVLHLRSDGSLQSEKLYYKNNCISVSKIDRYIMNGVAYDYIVKCDPSFNPIDTIELKVTDNNFHQITQTRYGPKNVIRQVAISTYSSEGRIVEFTNIVTTTEKYEPMCVQHFYFTYKLDGFNIQRNCSSYASDWKKPKFSSHRWVKTSY